MRILVIGGTRFIGLSLTTLLAARGHTVGVVNRGKTEVALPDGVTHLHGDTDQLEDSADALRAFAPDVVVHNIVLHDDHVRDVQRIFDGTARKLVMTSSMDVYQAYGRLTGKESGPIDNTTADEDSPLRTAWFPYRSDDMPADHRLYRYDKIPAERAALDHPTLAGTVVRLPMVIGPNDWQRRLLPFIYPMRAGRKTIVLDAVYAAWRSTYAAVENAAAALALAAEDERANGRVYNVADGAYSTLELGQMVADVLAWDGEFITAPADKLPESLHFGMVAQDLAVRGDRIRAELGFAPPVTFADAVRREIEWEIAHPPEQLPPGLDDFTAQDEALKALG